MAKLSGLLLPVSTILKLKLTMTEKKTSAERLREIRLPPELYVLEMAKLIAITQAHLQRQRQEPPVGKSHPETEAVEE